MARRYRFWHMTDSVVPLPSGESNEKRQTEPEPGVYKIFRWAIVVAVVAVVLLLLYAAQFWL